MVKYWVMMKYSTYNVHSMRVVSHVRLRNLKKGAGGRLMKDWIINENVTISDDDFAQRYYSLKRKERMMRIAKSSARCARIVDTRDNGLIPIY